jgi:UDP-glucuronate 4-epimerase
MKILVTGAAGFIGFHSSLRLLAAGHEIVGIDNLNDYYDVRLKLARLEQLERRPGFRFQQLDLADRQGMAELFEASGFEVVLHLGAQAGVRYSIENPFAYLDSNLTGMLTVLEGCRHQGVKHLVYASSSSVYGSNTKLPFTIEDRVDTPISLYAASKKANELMCHTYAHLYGFPITGLRFFTVYGPWGRPDMAYFKFADAIMAGRSIDVYNNGDMKRDFTYIDDVVDGIEAIVSNEPAAREDQVPHRVYNLGHNHPEQLLEMIQLLEKHLGRQSDKSFLPMQPGDVYATYADITATTRDYGFTPKVSLDTGLRRFAEWYMAYSPELASRDRRWPSHD